MSVRPMPRHGVYEEPFWQYVESGRLHLQRCDDCGHFWYPPGPSCPACLSRVWTWTPVRGTGQLLTWATFHRQYFESMPPPYTVVAATLAEGPILITDIEATHAELSAGMDLHLVYRAAESADGQQFRLYHWAVGAEDEPPPPEAHSRSDAPNTIAKEVN